MRLRTGVALVGVAAVGAVVVTVGLNAVREVTPFLRSEECTATVNGHTVTLDLEQSENAALIAAIAVRRGMPARAVTIALATAYQESKIYNIDFGDRDSLGLFQQRPSQGWGTPEQVQDPVYATNTFYDALDKVDGYDSMEVTVAAQTVQRSAYPDAYADHEADARVLASALTGNSPGTFQCSVDGADSTDQVDLGDNGLVPRAEKVREDLEARFGDLPLGGFEPEGVSTGHMEGSAHYEGRAIDVFVRPINEANKKRGWSIAHYLVAQADRLDLETVIFDGRIWSARRSGSGWRDYTPDTSGRDAATAAILEHRDHVHVDVAD